MNRLSYCIVILSYDDGDLLKIPLSMALQSNASKIVLAAGGNIPYDFLNSINDKRFVKVIESQREGKSRAITNAIGCIEGDVTFLVSGDINFNSSIFESMLELMDEKVGVVVPRVMTTKGKGLLNRVADVIWDVHDSQLSVLSSISANVHGGELIVVRTEILKEFREVVNDDAFLCLKSEEKGKIVRYDRNSVVKSIPPNSFNDFIAQRRRVNFGHLQLMKMDMDPKVMDTLLFTQPGLFLLILRHFLKNYKEDTIYFPIAAFCEMIALLLSRIDGAVGMDHKIWKIVPRSLP